MARLFWWERETLQIAEIFPGRKLRELLEQIPGTVMAVAIWLTQMAVERILSVMREPGVA